MGNSTLQVGDEVVGRNTDGDEIKGRIILIDSIVKVEGIDEYGNEGVFYCQMIKLKKASEPVIQKPIVKSPEGGVTIHHYTHKDEPYGAEYISNTDGKIDITSHGLGSGIYGFAVPEHAAEMIKERKGIKDYQVKIKNPFMIQDSEHGQRLTSMSKALQVLATDVLRDAQTNGKSRGEVIKALQDGSCLEKNSGNINSVASSANKVFAEAGHNINMTSGEMREFIYYFIFYHQLYPGRPIEAPITRLMWKYGFDGIYATDSQYDSVTRGNVKFVRPGEDITRHVRVGAEQFPVAHNQWK